MEIDILTWLGFFAVGFGASLLNSIAGGGSVFSLPVMIWLGLPPTVAHGTNRVGLIGGNLSSAWNLYRHGYLNKKVLMQIFWPSVLGTLAGLPFLLTLSDDVFKAILAVAIALVAIMGSLKKDVFGKPPEQPPEKGSIKGFIGFFLIAIYGCIVQVGMGFVQIFALRRYSGEEMIRVNAVKNVITTVILVIGTVGLVFAGKVRWDLAVITAIGSWFGGRISSMLQYKKGNKFIERTVQIAAVAVAVKLLYDVFAA